MAPLPQSQIPTLAVLYAAKRLAPAPSSQVLFPPPSSPRGHNNAVGLIRTDITTLKLENGAIVNAANARLLGGGGVDGAIHRAAGPGLLSECRTLGRARTGQSKITNAYELPCKAVIHAVGPVYSMDANPEELLTSCYESSLKLAVDNSLDSIAFSAVSTGVYGYPSGEAAHIACRAVRKFLDSDDGKKLDLVVFCNFEKKDEDAYHKIVPLYFPPDEKPQASEVPGEAVVPTDKAEKDRHASEEADADKA